MKFNSLLKSKYIIIIVLLYIIIITPNINVWGAREEPKIIFEGDVLSEEIYENINYNDLRIKNLWSKEAIYEISSLGIMQGYGEQYFARTEYLSKEQALALVLSSVGKEKEALLLAEQLEQLELPANRSNEATKIWSRGYLQLAFNSGLITFNQFQDSQKEATEFDEENTEDAFIRTAPTTREEMAVYIAKALALEPVYGQDKIFNSFIDWKYADPLNIPYIEAVLLNEIMHGNPNGYFYPTSNITREEAAQVIKNSMKFIDEINGFNRMNGTVEGFDVYRDYTNNKNINKRIINVRNSDGELYQINITNIKETINTGINEISKEKTGEKNTDILVFKDDNLGYSRLLKTGDKIEYITDVNNVIKFAKVIDAKTVKKYVIGKVDNVDVTNKGLTLKVLEILDEEPDSDTKIKYNDFDYYKQLQEDEYSQVIERYPYSNNTYIFIDQKQPNIENIYKDYMYIFEIIDGIVNKITSLNYNLNNSENQVLYGVVEDNNPQLGYITLYNENGSGTKDILSLRKYTYSKVNINTVLKDGKKTDVENIEDGDRVYIELNKDQKLISISAKSGYTQKIGTVLFMNNNKIGIKYQDQNEQVLDIEDHVRIFKDDKLKNPADIKQGDVLKLFLNITPSDTRLKTIYIEGEESFVSGILKGKFIKYDKISDKLIFKDVSKLYNNKWNYIDAKGFVDYLYHKQLKIFDNGSLITTEDLDLYYKDEMVTFSTFNDYNVERITHISVFKSEYNKIPILIDQVKRNTLGSNKIQLKFNRDEINLHEFMTIMVKNGRIVNQTAIEDGDNIEIVSTKDVDSNVYANVVLINDTNKNPYNLYRIRISDINQNSDYIVSSYRSFNDNEWGGLYQIAKKYNLTVDTRFRGADGVLNLSNFVPYGESSYKEKVLYAVLDGMNTIELVDAPFCEMVSKGEVFNIISNDDLDSGSQISIYKVKNLNNTTNLWNQSSELTFNVLNNSIIMKDGKVVEISSLQQGNNVTILRSDFLSEDAYIIFID